MPLEEGPVPTAKSMYDTNFCHAFNLCQHLSDSLGGLEKPFMW